MQYSAIFVTVLAGILVIPFLIEHLGVDAFGLTALFTSIFATAQLLEMGLGASIGRYLTACLVAQDKDRYNRYFSFGFFLGGGLAVLLSAVFIAAAGPLLRLFNIPESMFAAAKMAFCANIIFSASNAFVLPMIRAVLISRHRFDLTSAMLIFLRISQICFWVVALKYTGLGIVGWSLGNLLSILLTLILAFIFAKRVCPFLRFVKIRSLKGFGEIYSLGWKVVVERLASYVEFTLNPILLPIYGTLLMNALYQTAAKAFSLSSEMIVSASAQLMPHATIAAEHSDIPRLRSIYLTSLRFSLSIATAAWCVMIFFAGPLFYCWVGKEMGPHTGEVARIFLALLTTQMIAITTSVQFPLLMGMKNMNFILVCNVVKIICVSVGAIALLKYTALGVFSVVVPNVIMKIAIALAQSVYISRLLKISWAEHFKSGYLGAMAMCAVYLGFLFVYQKFFPVGETLAAIGVNLMAPGLVGAVLLWFIAFRPEDRQRVRKMLKVG